VLRMLRDASAHAVPLTEVVPDWPDARQRDRAIDSLIADGLAEASDGLLRLPA
jgi:A/G-specific adenine glycosylase